MNLPVLATKLNVPRYRSDLVSRPGLVERAIEGLNGKATLICAPAGYGKTTFATELLTKVASNGDRAGNAEAPAVAWLSLDADDRDPERFVAGLCAALAGGLTRAGVAYDETIRCKGLAPEPAVSSIINTISDLDCRVILVLDDYHAVDSPAVDAIFRYLLEHIPEQLHLLVISRFDPSLPLARLRANQEVHDIRAADLRFTVAEAALFLNKTMGLALSEEQIEMIEAKTEGWVAALSIAALSLKNAPNVSAAVASISGSNRHVAAYFAEEALDSQPAEVRRFLTDTSILRTLTGPLCDALTGRSDGAETLEHLHRSNAFTSALDDSGEWYAYHQLFSELLQIRLREDDRSRVRDLHRKASAWFEAHGNLREAVHHAVEANDNAHVAALAERAIDEVFMQGGESRLILRWIDNVAPGVTARFPRLALTYAWALYYSGRIGEIEPLLAGIEQKCGSDVSDGYLAEVCRVRGMLASAGGDIDQMAMLYERSLELSPADDATGRAMAHQGIAIARMFGGRTKEAGRGFVKAVDMLVAAGEHGISLVSLAYLGLVRLEQGRLADAELVFRDALDRARQHGLDRAPIVGLIHAGWADLLAERDLLEEAHRHASRAEELSRNQNPLQVWLNTIVMTLATIGSEPGAGAAEELDRVVRFVRDPALAAMLQTARAVRAYLLLFARDEAREVETLAAIREWLGDTPPGASVPEEALLSRVVVPGRGPEFARIAAARAMIRLGELETARHYCRSATVSARTSGRGRSLVESLVVHAEAEERSGNRDLAVSLLAEALTLARPEGFVRVFSHAGPDCARLLYECATCGIEADYVRVILAAVPQDAAAEATRSDVVAANDCLFEPLSERELDVLRLVAEGRSNSEIGEALYISAQTVKTHTRNLYAKLEVHNRTEAVHRARSLGLLPLG